MKHGGLAESEAGDGARMQRHRGVGTLQQGGRLRDVPNEQVHVCVAVRGLKAPMSAQGDSAAWKINLIISGLVGRQHKSIKPGNATSGRVVNFGVQGQLWSDAETNRPPET